MVKAIPFLRHAIHWLDRYGLLGVTTFLLAFIPLYPKIPLFSPIEQYIVRGRWEDVFVLIAVFLWFIQVLRRKVTWYSSFIWLIGAYMTVAVLSVLSAMFLIQTIPLQPLHVSKSVLHLLRYGEYFSLFFVSFSAVKERRDIRMMLLIFALTVLGIVVYGYGQRYWSWPVISTMNREFSKGMILYLTEHARVQSTFAGHYDLGAFLVIALPLLLSFAVLVKKRTLAILYFVSYVAGLWLLILSASRTSFLSYVVGASIAIGTIGLTKRTWLQKVWWSVSRGSMVMIITMALTLGFGADLSERFLQVLTENMVAKQAMSLANSSYLLADAEITSLSGGRLSLIPKATPAPTSTSAPTPTSNALTPTDEVPEPRPTRPKDVYEDIPDLKVSITQDEDGVYHSDLIEQPRVFSECANTKGLSLCIRYEELWPRAVRGFQKNPLLGSGYATLNKRSVEEFTEAESTDNNYLRTLGETGALGFATFYGTILCVAATALYQYHKKPDSLGLGLAAGYLGAVIGLGVNAYYIDVFASSKVAFTFWSLSGLLMTYFLVINQTDSQTPDQVV